MKIAEVRFGARFFLYTKPPLPRPQYPPRPLSGIQDTGLSAEEGTSTYVDRQKTISI